MSPLLRVAFLVSCAALVAVAQITPLVIQAYGTTRQVGFQVGLAARDRIFSRWNRSDIQQYVQPFATANPLGITLMSQLLNTTAAAYPRLVDECRGVAEGSGLSFEAVFLLNALQEVTAYMANIGVPTGSVDLHVGHCTDVMSHDATTGQAVWGHNEDGGMYDRASTYFVNATITDGEHGVVSFFCLTYAGSVCANAYGWNSFGLAFSFNAVFPDYQDFLLAPVNFVARRLMECATSQELHAVLFSEASCSGKNANTFSTRLNPYTDPIMSVEASPQRAIGAHLTHSPRSQTALRQHLTKGVFPRARHFYHVNIYEILQVPCFPDPSSYHRLKVLNSYSPPNTTDDVRTMLGDTSDAQYPIYRNGTSVDAVQTLSTVVFDFVERIANVWWDANPRMASPTWRIKMW